MDSNADSTQTSLAPWYVAHTRPRCEKKLADLCQREAISVTLPTYASVKKYRGKKVVFNKPIFPGYVFLRLESGGQRLIYQSEYVANLLHVLDQVLFERQLNDILRALESPLEVYLAPIIRPGARVKIKSGPLRGVEGTVERRSGVVEVLLRLDFIAQAAAVKIDACDLELIE